MDTLLYQKQFRIVPMQCEEDCFYADGGKRSFIINLKIRVTTNRVKIFISIFLMMIVPIIRHYHVDENSDYLTLPIILLNNQRTLQPKLGPSSVLLP